MIWESAQDVIVTTIAVAAVVVLVRQVLALVWPQSERHACASCPANRSAPAQFAPRPAPQFSRRLRVLP